jgi:hypothetical protein
VARQPEFASAEEERAYLEGVKAQLEGAATKDEVVAIWQQHYLRIGHRKLGRLLLGRPLDEILKARG